MPHTRLSGLKAASTNKHLTRLAVKTNFIPLNLITVNSKFNSSSSCQADAVEVDYSSAAVEVIEVVEAGV